MRDVADQILTARRKRLLHTVLLFKPYKPAAEAALAGVETELGLSLPAELREFLHLVGYGDVDEDLSFRAEWFKLVGYGEHKGAVVFAQDTLGNFYAWNPRGDDILFFSRSESGCAVLAHSFRRFMEELARRDYKILDWAESLTLEAYDWSAA